MGQGLAECLADDTADRLLMRADAALRRPAGRETCRPALGQTGLPSLRSR